MGEFAVVVIVIYKLTCQVTIKYLYQQKSTSDQQIRLCLLRDRSQTLLWLRTEEAYVKGLQML